MSMDVSTILADLISESYKRNPKLTIFGIFFSITLVVVAVSTTEYLKDRDFKKNAPKDVVVQIQELEKLDEGLTKLSAFIQLQKQQLNEKQAVISSLEKKRSELEPIVNSQSEVVEAIFKVQEQRAQQNKWLDLGIGFALGILGSLIASVIFKLIDRRRGNI
ncbi:hypothetical protein [Catenovulum agarivorans]|uniref:hypothetical protein n=1 Tax=Catenovulum agarivorans TaxID=1172192 RepID=UPI00035D9674|nr:hypothetical protein [Catenovulum agarivorans]